MRDVTEIFIHSYAGRSQSEIATSLGVDRKTIRKYLVPAIAAGISPGGPPVTMAEWAERVGRWFPEVTDTRLRQSTWPEIERHRDYISEMLKLGVTQATIHQRLRDEQGLVASLKRWVRPTCPRRCAGTGSPCSVTRPSRGRRRRSTMGIWVGIVNLFGLTSGGDHSVRG